MSGEGGGGADVRLGRIATEVAVIVGSILLAFALDAWWDAGRERVEVVEMLDAVADEFAAEVVALDSVLASNDAALAWFDRVLERTDPDLPPLSPDSIRELASLAESGFQVYDPGFGALVALISAGGLGRVEDGRLRALLGGWQAEIIDLDWEREALFHRNQFSADAVASRGFGTAVWELGVWQARVDAMAADPMIRSSEALVAGSLAQYVADLRRLRERASTIAELLNRR